MKFSSDVTKENIENMMDVILHDLREYSNDAKKQYEKDNTNEFQHSMATAFQLAADMIENRLGTLGE